MEHTKINKQNALKKIATFCFAVLLSALMISSCKNTEEKNLVKGITYDVLINSDNLSSISGESWWKCNIERSKREAFIKVLFDKIDNSKITVTDENGKALTMENIKVRMIIKDTIAMMRQKEPYEYFDTVVNVVIKPEQINMIRFKESWTYDPETFEITKHIQSYGLSYSKKNIYSRVYHHEPFFWVMCDDQEVSTNPKKVLTERIAYSMPLYESHYPDVYNTIKIEGDTADIRAYLKTMWDAALNGMLKNMKDPDFTTLVFSDIKTDSVKNQITRSMKKNYSTTVTDKEIENSMLNYIMNYGKTLYFHERWTLDMTTMSIKKDIQVLSPGLNVKKNGLLMGSKYYFSLAFKNKMWQPL